MAYIDTPNPANLDQQQIGGNQTTYDAGEEARRKKQAGLGPDGRPIPNAGVYGQEQANAELAWQQANTASAAKLKSYQNQAGVLADGSVDPHNQYGGYQQLLQQQGSELDAGQENAMSRGLGGGPGLGNQAERGMRFGHAIQNLGFQRGLTNAQTNYGMELGQNDAQRRASMTSALQNALNNAWGDWTPPDMGTTDSAPTTGSGGPTNNQVKKPPKKQYRPGQAPTSLAVINNHLHPAKTKAKIAALNRAINKRK